MLQKKPYSLCHEPPPPLLFLFVPSSRRVHVTRTTLMELDGKFDVEPGNGGERDEVLARQKVDTFLIIPPKQVGKKSLSRSRRDF